MEHTSGLRDGAESIKRLLDRNYRSQVETFQRLMTDEAMEQLSAQLQPSEAEQLQTMLHDMDYLHCLPSAAWEGPAAETGRPGERSVSAGAGGRTTIPGAPGASGRHRRQRPTASELREMHEAQLAVRQLPPDLLRCGEAIAFDWGDEEGTLEVQCRYA